MIRLKVVVKPRSPLVLGSGMDNQNVRESHDYIAGSVVRGTLAQVILESLKQHSTSRRSLDLFSDPHHRTIFDAVFTTPSAARFGYLYPTYLQANDKTHDAFTLESFPAPVTTLACKPHRTDHPVLDVLQTTIRRGPRPQACTKCQERIERWRGFVIRHANGTHDWCKGAPRRPLVRVGLNRWTEAAEERILYVLDAVVSSGERDMPLAFVGFWTMSKQQWSQLKLLLDCFYPREQNGYRLRLGSARARGLGEVVLWCQQVPFPELAMRIENFQDAGFPDNTNLYFSLTARSPLLVYDETGAPARTLTPDVLCGYLSSVPAGLQLIDEMSFVEREVLSGWSQAWGLPKPVMMVIAAGSVFTYCVPKGEGDAVLEFLKDIETDGLGERRSEGLGDLIACEPFHVTYSSQMR